MKYIDEFRDRKIAAALAREIRSSAGPTAPPVFMEVCGTHTMNIRKFGIHEMLEDAVRLVSGPGCPVCVTPDSFLDKAIILARTTGVTIATFGDMMRVPGSRSSLLEERSKGADVRVVYSCMDALALAERHPKQEVAFLGVGFETTAPSVAFSVREAKRRSLRNYSVLCAHKTMPSALRALATGRGSGKIDGFLLPAHVSAIIGTRPYRFLASSLGKRCVVAGFEPLDILQGILMLIRQAIPAVQVQYSRVVKPEGNASARSIMREVFEECEGEWRGIGVIAGSGLKIRKRYARFDADARFAPQASRARRQKGCICGAVLRGAKVPPDCPLFGSSCTPETPRGPCMVSAEGTCSAYFKYRECTTHDTRHRTPACPHSIACRRAGTTQG